MNRSRFSDEYDDDRTIECSICFCQLDQPKQLPCLHSFCLKCLKKLCEGKQEGDLKPCPLCRAEFCIPIGGVEELPFSHFMMRLILKRRTSQQDTQQNKCEPCAEIGDDVEAEAFCMECKQCLCTRCKKYHAVMASSILHSVVNLDERPSEEQLLKMKPNYCDDHTNKEIEFYCSDCSMLLCYVCMFEKHGKHRCQLLEEVVMQKNIEIAKNENRIKKYCEESGNQLEDLQEVREKTFLEVSEVTKSIEEAFQNTVKQAISRKQQLLKDLAVMQCNILIDVDSQEDFYNQHVPELNNFLEYGRLLIGKGTDCEIIRVADEFNKKAVKLFQAQDECNRRKRNEFSITFVASTLPTTEECIGKVCYTDTLKTQPSSTHHQPSCNASHSQTVMSMKVEYPIMGLTVLNDQIFVVALNRSQISVYDSYTGRAKNFVNISHMKSPQGIAGCSHNNAIYISDWYLRSIYTVNLTYDSVNRWRLSGTYGPRGLSMTAGRNLLIVLDSAEAEYLRSKSTVVEYTTGGQLIRDIALDWSLEGLWQTVQLNENQFLICHGMFLSHLHRLHRLCAINSEGQIIKSYGRESGKGDGQLCEPRSLAVDKNTGRVFVADTGNNRVLVFNRDLALLGVIRDDILSPWCLHFESSSARLFVGDSIGRVTIAAYRMHERVRVQLI